jgi:hypothetical protein
VARMSSTWERRGSVVDRKRIRKMGLRFRQKAIDILKRNVSAPR